MSFKIQHGQIIPQQRSQTTNAPKKGDFERLYLENLKKTPEPLKLSAHAVQRMDQREIRLGETELKKINQALDTLEKKGARESMILLEDNVFIASIQNRTIITAMKSGEMETITNIDSAIQIK